MDANLAVNNAHRAPPHEFGRRESVLWSLWLPGLGAAGVGQGGRGSSRCVSGSSCTKNACAPFPAPFCLQPWPGPRPQVLVKLSPLWITDTGRVFRTSSARPKLQTNLYYISILDADIGLTCPHSTSPALSGSCPSQCWSHLFCWVTWEELEPVWNEASVQRFITCSQTPLTKKYLLKFSIANVVICLKSGSLGNSRCLSGAGRARLQCWVNLKEWDCFDFEHLKGSFRNLHFSWARCRNPQRNHSIKCQH